MQRSLVSFSPTKPPILSGPLGPSVSGIYIGSSESIQLSRAMCLQARSNQEFFQTGSQHSISNMSTV